jgi:hypothetical protein
VTVLCEQDRALRLAGFIYTREFIGHPNDIFQEAFCPIRYPVLPTTALLFKGPNIYNDRGVVDFSADRTSNSRAK